MLTFNRILTVALGIASYTLFVPDKYQRPMVGSPDSDTASQKDAFINDLLAQMNIQDLVLQMHLMFGDDIVGAKSENELYEYTMRLSPDSPIGVIQDWYSLNTSRYNELQQLNLEKAHLKIPFMHVGECLHGVGSYKQSIFPQNIGLSASFDTDLLHRVGRAIGKEATSIGIHACLSPVLDLGQDPRWGRVQEAWGEDKILASLMGVAYASGLSRNGSWSDPEAVVPVVKHFAAHGSPQAGHNAAPFTGHGTRQIVQDLMLPFKSAIQLGGVRGVMMAYNEFDGLPASVNPMFYQALDDWDFDGFVISDDLGILELETMHHVASSPKDALEQWFNVGGMIQYYDYSLETFLNSTMELVSEGTVQMSTLKSHVRKILDVKWDLGLFENPFISPNIEPLAIVESHGDLTLEAAHKSIILLKNENSTLPISPRAHETTKLALIGPFIDIVNYGGYSGQWGQYPVDRTTTLRQSILQHLRDEHSEVSVFSSWGANSWEYNAQYSIPPYHFSVDGAPAGLLATYYANTNFTNPLRQVIEVPALDWGLYPPPGLPSNNFSVVWEGQLASPVDTDDEVDGWIGLAISANSSAKLFIDDVLVVSLEYSSTSTIIGNIMPFTFIENNSTMPPPGAAPFTFTKDASHKVRVEFQTWNMAKKVAEGNVQTGAVNSEIILFWNLISSQGDAIDKAVEAAKKADVILLAAGAAWNSDGENGDRATLGLSPSQDALAKAMCALGKPVVLILQGGRPFAIPEFYDQSAAVLSTFFPGQSGGQAIADVLFGKENPGGRLPLTIPRSVGQIPAYYNHKASARIAKYVDVDSRPCFPFGYGLSYSRFSVLSFEASASPFGSNELGAGTEKSATFRSGDAIKFSVKVKNFGAVRGSYVAQVYLLGRVSKVTQPLRQLVAFKRVYLDMMEEARVEMSLEVDRYLVILNRTYQWELEKGNYTFAMLDNGGDGADTSLNVTMACI